MPTTPEIASPADASREKLVLAADTHRELAELAGRVTPSAMEASDILEPNLVEATKALSAQGRSPEEIAALTLRRGYPQAA
jgi:hypothetical protein